MSPSIPAIAASSHFQPTLLHAESLPQRSNADIAQEAFRTIRRAYSNGLKSSNKVYGADTEDNFYVRRAAAAEQVNLLIQRQNRENLRNQFVPPMAGKKVFEAGNCGELARAIAKEVVLKGGYAEVWSFEQVGDHAFTVIGHPPARESVNFANWRGIWIADGWTGVLSAAPEYIATLSDTMQRWQRAGRQILVNTQGERASPTEKSWMESILSGKKFRLEAPSTHHPNPWITMQTAVDYRRYLTRQDDQSGTLRFGDVRVSRAELYDMGVLLDGKSIGPEGIRVQPSRGELANRLQFDSQIFADLLRTHHHSSQSSLRQHAVLFAISQHRTSTRPLMVNRSGNIGKLFSLINLKLAKLNGLAQRGRARLQQNLVTLILPGKKAVRHTGVGLQIFGIYNSVRGIHQGIAEGKPDELAVSLGAFSAEGISFAAERWLPAFGKYLQKGQVQVFNAFAQTPVGIKLGGSPRISNNIGRSAGALGVLISLPFDIYSASTSFTAASKSRGHAAQDHYVHGGLAVAGASSSLALAGAAYAGVAAAGPIGIALGALLALGSGLYSGVRYVEDLANQIELTRWDRFVTGISAVFGGSGPQYIQDRLAVHQARQRYRRKKTAELQQFMAKTPCFQFALFGQAAITPQPPDVEDAFIGTVIIQNPPTVEDNVANDVIDGRNGVQGLAQVVSNPVAQGTDIFWSTGDGNDRLMGVLDRNNTFDIRRGIKTLTGGDRQDTFQINVEPTHAGLFDGRKGRNTLHLNYVPRGTDSEIEIKLPTRSSHGYLTTANNVTSKLSAFSNVITSAHLRSFITAPEGDSVLVLNGMGDRACGGAGSDVYVVNGRGVIDIDVGEGLTSQHLTRFYIARTVDQVMIAGLATGLAKTELNLDFDSSEIRVHRYGSVLEILPGEEQRARKVILSGMFHQDTNGTRYALRSSQALTLISRDGYVLVPELESLSQENVVWDVLPLVATQLPDDFSIPGKV